MRYKFSRLHAAFGLTQRWLHPQSKSILTADDADERGWEIRPALLFYPRLSAVSAVQTLSALIFGFIPFLHRDNLRNLRGFQRIVAQMIAALVVGTASLAVAADGSEDRVPPMPEVRVPQTEMGITQLSNKKLDWLLDDKFGMFIHWGLYSGLAQGEWAMENQGIPADKYRELAYPASGDHYFSADQYHPQDWAKLAKDAGMKWMCLTTRHHEGFCLFDTPAPNAFTSMQTLHRDLVAEYVTACRAAGLKVGLYYSPLSWRYPGYYDVTGTKCSPNHFGITADPAHVENARLMKEENYVNVKKLMTGYGHIDQIFWDGGWLGQHGSDADAAFFHEPGKYLDPANRWPIDAQYQDLEAGTGKPLGIMGMVRKYQPDAITNLRYGWMGDIIEEEGPRETKGPIRSRVICDKCLSMQDGPWGFSADAIAQGHVMSRDDIIGYLANCVMRNMTLLVNVSPDRHGVIPELEQKRLREVGAWVAKASKAIYGTRGGPWEPVDGQYGCCYSGNTVYFHLLKQYAGDTLRVPPLGDLRVVKAYEVIRGNILGFSGDGKGGTIVGGIDRTASTVDTIIAVQFSGEVKSVWATVAER
jgi:alpha-L-fucosidase